MAKQDWRLILYPNSLVAKILKAKYFTNTNFLKAGFGSHLSYSWKSILFNRDLLKLGLRWRIGNLRSVWTFLDPWIPANGHFRPITPLCFLNEQFKVEELIQGGLWRHDLLSVLFCPRDRELITAIPLVRTRGTNTLTWLTQQEALLEKSIFAMIKFVVNPSQTTFATD